MRARPLLLTLIAVWATLPRAETVKDREGAVRADRARHREDPRWIYNDVERGFREATRLGKPLLVTLRCVPCLSCLGMDAAVLESRELSPWLDAFVCVRVINANALDLGRFQFDYDLSFSTLFFNGDGTVYGRFGSWMHQRDREARDLHAFLAALEGALAIHRGYPGNRLALAGKQGAPTPFRTPVEIPALAGKYGRELDWGGKVVQSCVHCHQIGDALRTHHRQAGRPLPPELIYPMPDPLAVGLRFDPHAAARVEAVEPGSAAARAGFRPGDEVAAANGSPLLSVTDLAWALHRSPERGELRLLTRRAGVERELRLPLEEGWRARSDISGRVGTWGMRGMALGGLKLERVPDAERGPLALSPRDLALRVKHVGQYGAHAAAKQAGFRVGDVLVAVEGVQGDLSEGGLIGHLLTHQPKPVRLPARVLRDGRPVDLRLPVQ
jgi:hypothetical protein